MKHVPTVLVLVAACMTIQSRSAGANSPADFALQAGGAHKAGPAAVSDGPEETPGSDTHAADGRHAGLEFQLGLGNPAGAFALGPTIALNRFLSVEAAAGLNLSGFQISSMARVRYQKRGAGISLGAGMSFGNDVEGEFSLFTTDRTTREKVVWQNIEAAFHLPMGESQLRISVGHGTPLTAGRCSYERDSGSWDHPETDTGDCTKSDPLPDARTYVTFAWSRPIEF